MRSLFSTNRNYSSFFIVIDPLLAANLLIICLCKSSVSKHPIDILRTCKIPKPAVKSNSPRYKGISPQTDLGFALKNVVSVTSGYIRNLPKCSRWFYYWSLHHIMLYHQPWNLAIIWILKLSWIYFKIFAASCSL